MAGNSININLNIFKQAPDYYDDAYSAIKKSISSLASYEQRIDKSKFTDRTTEFNARYNQIADNTKVARNNANGLEELCKDVIKEVEKHLKDTGGNIYGNLSIDTSALSDTVVAASTGSVVGDYEKTTWWDSVGDFFRDTGFGEVLQSIVATVVEVLSSLLQGLAKIVEGIIDAVAGLTSLLVIGGASLLNLFGASFDVAKIKSDWMTWIGTDWVGSGVNWFYENTGFGKWLGDYGIIHGTLAEDIIVGVGTWVGIIGISILTFGAGTPAALVPALSSVGVSGTTITAATAGIMGFGSGLEGAYASGKSYMAGMGIGALKGTFDALTGRAIGKVTNGFMIAAKNGYFITQMQSGNILKVTHNGKTGWKQAWKVMYGSADDVLGGAAKSGGSTALVPFDPKIGAAIVPSVGATSTALVPIGTQALVGPILGSASVLPGVTQGILTLGQIAAGTAAGTTIMALTELGSKGTIVDLGTPNSTGTPGITVPDNNPDDNPNPNKPNSNPGDIGNNPDDSGSGLDPLPPDDGDKPIQNLPEPDDVPNDSGTLNPDNGNNSNNGSNGDNNNNNGSDNNQPSDDNLIPDNSGSENQNPNDSTDEKPTEGEDSKDENPSDEDIEPDDELVDTPEEDEPTNNEDSDDETLEDLVPPEDILPSEGKDPNITFVNVGPATVDVTPSVSSGSNFGAGSGIVGGGVTNSGSSGSVEFMDHTTGEIDVNKEEPIYTFESMEPTFELPELDEIILEPLGSENLTTSVGTPIETIDVSSLTDLSQGQPEYDTSMLGMGGLTFGTAAASMYGASRRNEDKDKVEKEQVKTELKDNNERIDEI